MHHTLRSMQVQSLVSLLALDCHTTYTPQRRPAVFTGASHSLVSSSSSLSRVIEQPAISSEVMYEPTRLRAILMPVPCADLRQLR